MKSKIKVFLLIFTALGFMFSACNKSEDIVTADAKEGGLVVPTNNVPYKLNATPVVAIALSVPQGPGITTVEVYNKYTDVVSGTSSNQVLMKTINVASANAAAAVAEDYTITYADLIKDLQINGAGLPADEGELAIGNSWKLSYVSVMSDGRRVVNNSTTTIAVANFFAGSYNSEVLYFHPTAGGTYPTTPYSDAKSSKTLTPTSATSCYAFFGVWVANITNINIDATNHVTTTFDRSDAVSGDPNDPTKVNSYDPATGVIKIYYFYPGAGGNRIFWETFTPAK